MSGQGEPILQRQAYLCGSSRDVNADVRLENLAAMIQTICEFRAPDAPA